MFATKTLLGILTIVIGLVSYSLYFKDIFKAKNKPDAFSWLIWGVLACIAFFAQISEGGGPGTWVTAFTAIMCFAISATAFLKNYGHLKTHDAINLFGAGVGLCLWYYTNNPLFAVIIILSVGGIGFFSTYQKAYKEPAYETASTYALNALKFAVAFLALDSINLVTALYPAGMIIMNTQLAGMIFLRRKTLAAAEK